MPPVLSNSSIEDTAGPASSESDGEEIGMAKVYKVTAAYDLFCRTWNGYLNSPDLSGDNLNTRMSSVGTSYESSAAFGESKSNTNIFTGVGDGINMASKISGEPATTNSPFCQSKANAGEFGGSSKVKPPAPEDQRENEESSPLISKAKAEWNREKDLENVSNPILDRLMDMIGLEEVKNQFLSIKTKVDIAKEQGITLKDERFNCSILGNPGTGKRR